MIDKLRLSASERRFLTLDLQGLHSYALFEASGTATRIGRICLTVLLSTEILKSVFY